MPPISFLQFRFGADGGARAFGPNDHEAPRRPKRTGAPNSRRRRRRPAPPELQTAPPELRRRRGQQPDRQIRRTGPERYVITLDADKRLPREAHGHFSQLRASLRPKP